MRNKQTNKHTFGPDVTSSLSGECKNGWITIWIDITAFQVGAMYSITLTEFVKLGKITVLHLATKTPANLKVTTIICVGTPRPICFFDSSKAVHLTWQIKLTSALSTAPKDVLWTSLESVVLFKAAFSYFCKGLQDVFSACEATSFDDQLNFSPEHYQGKFVVD